VNLIGTLDPGNPLVQQRLQGIAANLVAHGYPPASAQKGALALLDAQVTRQASMLSYNDAWMLLLITFVVVSPAILLLRRPRPLGAGPAAAH
jgi:DHA2 family multidrug resistance protein